MPDVVPKIAVPSGSWRLRIRSTRCVAGRHHSQTQMHPGSLGPDGLGDRPMKVDGMNADSFQVIAGDQVKENGTLNDDDAHDLTDYRTDGFQGNFVKELAPTPGSDNGTDDKKFVDTPPNEQNDVEKVNAKLSPCC